MGTGVGLDNVDSSIIVLRSMFQCMVSNISSSILTIMLKINASFCEPSSDQEDVDAPHEFFFLKRPRGCGVGHADICIAHVVSLRNF